MLLAVARRLAGAECWVLREVFLHLLSQSPVPSDALSLPKCPQSPVPNPPIYQFTTEVLIHYGCKSFSPHCLAKFH
ncbi:hypothetical protein ACQFX9_21670 [Aliinostoc sp. HNIBRCY26]|uniref:hypothetical protein n=1 Tax=Aliinostoc sp. HNIBRCY26 TaxID=3418997 RepID=UPI003D066603